MTNRTELTTSQAKAINRSRTMGWLRAQQRVGGEIVTGKTVSFDCLGYASVQVRTNKAAYDWNVSTRGRMVWEDRTEYKQ